MSKERPEGGEGMWMLFAEIYNFYRQCVMEMGRVWDSMKIKWTHSEEDLKIFKGRIGHLSWCLVNLVRSCQRQKNDLGRSWLWFSNVLCSVSQCFKKHTFNHSSGWCKSIFGPTPSSISTHSSNNYSLSSFDAPSTVLCSEVTAADKAMVYVLVSALLHDNYHLCHTLSNLVGGTSTPPHK